MTGPATLTVGPLRAGPRSKVRGAVQVDLGVTVAEVPVTPVGGAAAGPRVVITGGVHGGEFVGVDAAARLAAELDPANVRGQVVISPVANPPAVYQGRLGVSPLDGININRIFPGDPDGRPIERMAAWLFEHLIPGGDAYVDLHCGGVDEVLCDFVGYRLTGDAALDEKARAMAYAVGYEHICYSPSAEGGNSHAAAARMGIPAILVETGERGDRDAATTRTLVDGLYRLLHHLGVLDEPPATAAPADPQQEWIWAAWVEAPHAGLWFPDFTRGSEVTEGQTIGRIVDPADGSEHKVTASATGRIFYGMYGLTVAAGDELAAIANRAATGSNSDARTR